MALGNFGDQPLNFEDIGDSPFNRIKVAGEVAKSPLNTAYDTPEIPEASTTVTKQGGQSGDVAAGFSAGVHGLKGLYYGAKSLIADTLGDEEGFKESTKKFLAEEQAAQEANKGRISSIGDIKWGEEGASARTFDYVQNMFGQAIPSLLTSIGSGLVGAAFGTAATAPTGPGAALGAASGFVGGTLGKNLVKNAVAKRVAEIAAKKQVSRQVAEDIAKKQVARQVGASVGMLASSYAMGLGDIYNETRGDDEKGAIASSFIGALPYAALDAITEIGLLGRLGTANAGEGVLKRYAKAMASTGVKEGFTESAQEALLMEAGLRAGKEYTTEQVLERLGNSFAAGTIAGITAGPLGAMGSRSDPLGNAASIAAEEKIKQQKAELLQSDREQRMAADAGIEYENFPNIRKLFTEASRLNQGYQARENFANTESNKNIQDAYKTRIIASIRDLNKIANEQDAEGNFTTKSELEREQAKQAIERIRNNFTVADEELFPVSKKEKVKEKQRKKKKEEQASTTPQGTPSETEITTNNQEITPTESISEPTPTPTQVEEEQEVIPEEPLTKDEQEVVTTLPEVPSNEDQIRSDIRDNLARKEGSKPIQEILNSSNLAPSEFFNIYDEEKNARDAVENIETTVTPEVNTTEDETKTRIDAIRAAAEKAREQAPTQNTEVRPIKEEATPTLSPTTGLRSNAYGGTQGKGYAKKNLNKAARNQLSNLYGENWEQEGNIIQGADSRWYYEPNDPNVQPNITPKKSKNVGRKKNVKVNEAFTPLTKDGSPYFQNLAEGAAEPSTGRMMYDGANFLMEAPDGSWFIPKNISQKRLANHNAIDAALPRTNDGTGATIVEPTQAELAKQEEQNARTIADAEKQNKLQEAFVNRFVENLSQEQKDFINQAMVQMEENTRNGVSDNLKQELNTVAGMDLPFVAWRKIHEKIKPTEVTSDQTETRQVPSSEQQGQEPRGAVQEQEASPEETQTGGVLQTPEEVIAPVEREDLLTRTAKDDKQFTKAISDINVVSTVDNETYPLYDNEYGVFSIADDDYIPLASINTEGRKKILQEYTTLASTYGSNTIVEDTPVLSNPEDELETQTIKGNEFVPFNDNGTTIESLEERAKTVRELYAERRKINDHIDRIVTALRKANPGIKIDVFHSEDEIRKLAETDQLIKRDLDHILRIKGYHYPGINRIGIIAYKAKSVRDAEATLLHEMVGHRGMQGLFGKKWKNFIEKSIRTNPKAFSKAFQNLAMPYRIKYEKYDPAKHKSEEWYTVRHPDSGEIFVVNAKDAFTLMNEYIASLAESFANPEFRAKMDKNELSYIRRAIAYIKHLLRSVVGYPVTDEDILSLLHESYKRTFKEGPQVESLEQNYEKINKLWTKVLGDKLVTNPAALTKSEEALRKAFGIVTVDSVIQHQAEVETNRQEFNSIQDNALQFSVDINEPIQNVDMFTEMVRNNNYQNSIMGNFKKWADGLNNKVSTTTSPYFDMLGNLPGKTTLRQNIRETLGAYTTVERLTDTLSRTVWNNKKISEEQNREIRDAWLDGKIFRGEFKPRYLNSLQIAALGRLSRELSKVQENIVQSDFTNIPDDVKQEILASKGMYLHRQYIKRVDNEYIGRGLLPSALSWTRGRVRSDQEAIIRGSVQESKFNIVNTINMLARDHAMLGLQDTILSDSAVHNLGWTLSSHKKRYPVMVGNVEKNMTLAQMRIAINEQRESLSKQSITLRTPIEQAEAEARLQQLEAAYETYGVEETNAAKEQMMNRPEFSGRTPDSISSEEVAKFIADNYTFIDPRASEIKGPLTGYYLDNRIHKVLIQDAQYIKNDSKDFANAIFGLGPNSLLTRATSLWKGHMTVGNIAYWPRAVMGAGTLLDFGSDTNSITLTRYWLEEIRDAFLKKPTESKTLYDGQSLMDWGLQMGMFSTGFSTQELYALRDELEATGAAAEFKKAMESKNLFGALGPGMQMMKNGYFGVMKRLSDASINIDGTAKLAMMRDYLEIHAKQNGYKNGAAVVNAYARESKQKSLALMRAASQAAAQAEFEYHDIPNWVKTLRKVPLGTPFVTFNYKMFGALSRTMVRRPWKLAKYYIAGWAITQALLAASDWDDDDLKEAYNTLPIYQRNKSNLYIIPFKNEDGQVHYADMTYSLPHSFLFDAALKLTNPMPGENPLRVAKETTGILGGPIPTAIAAIMNRRDPFTGRDLYVPGQSTEDNVARFTKFIWNMSVPPWLGVDTFGVGSGGGIISDAFNADYVEANGKDKAPFLTTDLPSLSGISFKAYRPEDQRTKNIKFFQYKAAEIKKERAKIAKNPNIDIQEKQKKFAEFSRRLKELNDQRIELTGR